MFLAHLYIIYVSFTYKMNNIRIKILRNKRNNQLFMALSRKKMKLKKKNPKFINIEKASFEF